MNARSAANSAQHVARLFLSLLWGLRMPAQWLKSDRHVHKLRINPPGLGGGGATETQLQL